MVRPLLWKSLAYIQLCSYHSGRACGFASCKWSTVNFDNAPGHLNYTLPIALVSWVWTKLQALQPKELSQKGFARNPSALGESLINYIKNTKSEYSHVHNSIIHNSQKVDTVQMSLSEQIHKYVTIHAIRILWSLKKEMLTHATTWRKLEENTVNEISYSKKSNILWFHFHEVPNV